MACELRLCLGADVLYHRRTELDAHIRSLVCSEDLGLMTEELLFVGRELVPVFDRRLHLRVPYIQLLVQRRFGSLAGNTVRSGTAVSGFVSAACDPDAITRTVNKSSMILKTFFMCFISFPLYLRP